MAQSAVLGKKSSDNEHQVSAVEVDVLCLVPDLVIVDVLKKLDTSTLLACRLLNHRVKGLVQLPQVWAHRRIASSSDLRAVLLLAPPRVQELHIDFHRSPEVDAMLPGMACAAKKLCLNFHYDFPGETELIITVLRNQAKLAHLEDLTVWFVNWWGDSHVFCELMSTIMSISSSLISLHIDVEFAEGLYPKDELELRCAFDVAPFLKRLRYCMEPYSTNGYLDPLLEKLLVAHAATLEEVVLESTPFSYRMTWPSTRFPRLSKIICPAIKGMDTLVECKTLKTLGIFVLDDDSDFPPELYRLLALTRCTHLRLIYQGDFSHYSYGLNLVNILAFCGQGTVRKLTIDQTWLTHSGFIYNHSNGICQLFWSNLIDALPWLSALEELCVDLGDTSLLCRKTLMQAIRPNSTHFLRKLHLKFHGAKDPKCTHYWLHQPSVQKMLSANPNLLLCVESVDCQSIYGDDNHCYYCKSLCHKLGDNNEFTCSSFW